MCTKGITHASGSQKSQQLYVFAQISLNPNKKTGKSKVPLSKPPHEKNERAQDRERERERVLRCNNDPTHDHTNDPHGTALILRASPPPSPWKEDVRRQHTSHTPKVTKAFKVVQIVHFIQIVLLISCSSEGGVFMVCAFCVTWRLVRVCQLPPDLREATAASSITTHTSTRSTNKDTAF